MNSSAARASGGPLRDAILRLMLASQNAQRRQVLERMRRLPSRTLRRQPQPRMHSPLWLIVHLAEVERHYLGLLSGEPYRGESLTLPASKPEPQQWPPTRELLRFVADMRQRWTEAVERLSDEQLARSYGPQPWLTGAWIVAHVFEHESYHMGQLRWALRFAESEAA